MNNGGKAIVLFGDVVGSRRAPAAASAWLRNLCRQLESLYSADRMAPFAFTQGDELQGLLKPLARGRIAVTYARGGVRSIERLADAVRTLFAAGVRAAA